MKEYKICLQKGKIIRIILNKVGVSENFNQKIIFNLNPEIGSQLKTERKNKDPKQTKTWKIQENESLWSLASKVPYSTSWGYSDRSDNLRSMRPSNCNEMFLRGFKYIVKATLAGKKNELERSKFGNKEPGAMSRSSRERWW